MSEESEKQPAAEAAPAPPRRRAPRRRTPRATTQRKSTANEAESSNGVDSGTAQPENAGGPEKQRAKAEDADWQPSSAPVEAGGTSSNDGASDRAAAAAPDEGNAPEVTSKAMTDKMQLGTEEPAAATAAADPNLREPRRDRNFRGRGRGRDGRRDFNRDRDRGYAPREGGGEHQQGQQEQSRPPENESQQQNQHPQQPEELEFGEGIIEISGKGFGFLREAKRNFVQTPQDIVVTPEIVRRFALRDGMWIQGETRRGNRGPQLMRLNKINDDEPTKYQDLVPFEELTTINPNKRIKLETVPERYTTRVMDMMTPLGMGQRGLIVAPPRTGKTTLLHHIADAVTKNHPEMKLIILLVDERPEEVTDFRRSCPGAEIMASSSDTDIKSHTRIAQLAIERAKRMVEAGKHVFILLDSITRTARAFNNATGGGGRTMSGGIDARAMEIPRKIFAAARNTEEAGSLTIVATALIETGSRMDELIFQEFKGTGNMELVLDRKISDQRIYPAVDIFLSGTRREELLLQPWELDKINLIRRGLAGHKPGEAIERLLMFVKKFPTNTQMLKEIPG